MASLWIPLSRACSSNWYLTACSPWTESTLLPTRRCVVYGWKKNSNWKISWSCSGWMNTQLKQCWTIRETSLNNPIRHRDWGIAIYGNRKMNFVTLARIISSNALISFRGYLIVILLSAAWAGLLYDFKLSIWSKLQYKEDSRYHI